MPALGKKRLVTKSSTNDAQSNADRVIRNDSRSNHPQVWRPERLAQEDIERAFSVWLTIEWMQPHNELWK